VRRRELRDQPARAKPARAAAAVFFRAQRSTQARLALSVADPANRRSDRAPAPCLRQRWLLLAQHRDDRAAGAGSATCSVPTTQRAAFNLPARECRENHRFDIAAGVPRCVRSATERLGPTSIRCRFTGTRCSTAADRDASQAYWRSAMQRSAHSRPTMASSRLIAGTDVRRRRPEQLRAQPRSTTSCTPCGTPRALPRSRRRSRTTPSGSHSSARSGG
jgi:hypothetical protein